MQLVRILSAYRRRNRHPLSELLQRAGEFKKEGAANTRDVAHTSRTVQCIDSYYSMIYGTDGSQMGRRTIRLLIGPGLSPMETMVFRTVRSWLRRQVRRFSRR